MEKELGGKTGIVDIIWKAKAMQHLTEHTVEVGTTHSRFVRARAGKVTPEFTS